MTAPLAWIRNPISNMPWGQLRSIWLHPKRTLESLFERAGGTWRLPLLVLSILAAAHVITAAPLLRAQVLSNPPPLPQDFQYYPPAMQEQYMRAVEVTSGTAFIYIFPLAQSVLRIWLGWLLVGSLLYAIMTLFGARSDFASMLALSAWAGLPYLLKDAVQIGYMLLSRHLISEPGLSAFGSESGTSLAQFWMKALETLDLYLLWQLVLIGIGLSLLAPNRRSLRWLALLLVLVIVVTFQALPGFLGLRLSSMTVIRPYF